MPRNPDSFPVMINSRPMCLVFVLLLFFHPQMFFFFEANLRYEIKEDFFFFSSSITNVSQNNLSDFNENSVLC